MQACQQPLYPSTLVGLERLSSVYRDDSVSQETLPTVLEVVGHVWPLLPMIAILSCSTNVTGFLLQQQLGNSMVFIHKLWQNVQPIRAYDHISVKFSPDVIELQGWIGAAITCTSNVLIGIWFCFPTSRFNLSHADGREQVYHHQGECLPIRASLSGTVCEVVQS